MQRIKKIIPFRDYVREVNRSNTQMTNYANTCGTYYIKTTTIVYPNSQTVISSKSIWVGTATALLCAEKDSEKRIVSMGYLPVEIIIDIRSIKVCSYVDYNNCEKNVLFMFDGMVIEFY